MKIIKHTLKDAPIIDIVKGHLGLWVGGFGVWVVDTKDEKFVKTKTLFFNEATKKVGMVKGTKSCI
jgi:hypothetical protein